MSTSLRGSIQALSSAIPSSSSKSPRILQSSPDLSSTWFIAGIVALIILFYLICVYQCIIAYCRRKLFGGREAIAPNTNTGTVLVHEGRVFNLSDDQRRAVLEAIYADNSKPATDLDVAPTRRKRRRKVFGRESVCSDDENDDNNERSNDDEDAVPVNVEIPGIETIGSLVTQFAREDLDAENIELYPEVEFKLGSGSLDMDSDYSDADDGHIDREFVRARSCSKSESLSPSEGSTPRSKESWTSPVAANASSLESSEDDDNHFVRDSNLAGEASVRFAANESTAAALPLTLMEKNACLSSEAPLPERCDSTDSWENYENPAILPLPDLSSLHARSNLSTGTLTDAATRMEEKIEEGDAIEREGEGGGSVSQMEITDSVLSTTSPFLRRESFTTQTSEYTYDDDSCTCTTGDNVCPICLSGFVMGDILIMSKHCSHVFHKECILEWLQKHDDCPVCRASMITETEMNRAATSLVGKTRMYRAVASMNTQNLHRPLSPARSTRQAEVSPFSGTVRRSAFSYS